MPLSLSIMCRLLSVLTAIKNVTESPPKLEGYLALTDSIVHLILHCEEKMLDVEKLDCDKNIAALKEACRQLSKLKKTLYAHECIIFFCI